MIGSILFAAKLIPAIINAQSGEVKPGTREWALRLARMHGANLPHEYIVDGWQPHEWVVQALMDAYMAGFEDGSPF